ncbi:type I methionyl aminopeptidase [symbiont of Argiope bruennichi]|uniref:type I methionyl aminopeptidase n=1 Tax=symbiont of Argiope bruennichi TaxID=2810479 RepID=UPI003DA37010
MSVILPKDQEKIRYSGKILAFLLNTLKENAYPGNTSKNLDLLANDIIISKNCTPSFLNYNGYKHSICVSVNDTMIHGTPSDVPFKDGDMISIDAGVCYQGFHTDAAISFICGKNDADIKEKLLKTTKEALDLAIKEVKSEVPVRKLGKIIENVIMRNGFFTCYDYCGHGVGKKLHDLPLIFNYDEPECKDILKENMVIAIEPMVLLSTSNTFVAKNGWDVKSTNGCLTCHFEHTILVKKNGSEVLTS